MFAFQCLGFDPKTQVVPCSWMMMLQVRCHVWYKGVVRGGLHYGSIIWTCNFKFYNWFHELVMRWLGLIPLKKMRKGLEELRFPKGLKTSIVDYVKGSSGFCGKIGQNGSLNAKQRKHGHEMLFFFLKTFLRRRP